MRSRARAASTVESLESRSHLCLPHGLSGVPEEPAFETFPDGVPKLSVEARTGTTHLLYLRVAFADDANNGDPDPNGIAAGESAPAAQAFAGASHGRLNLVIETPRTDDDGDGAFDDGYDYVRMPGSRADFLWAVGGPAPAVRLTQAVLARARAQYADGDLSVDPDAARFTNGLYAIRSSVSDFGPGVTNSYATGQTSVTKYSDPFRVLLHEIGHTLGLDHASVHFPGSPLSMSDDESPIKPGVVSEGLDIFSFMGGDIYDDRQVSLPDRYRLGWTTPAEVPLVDTARDLVLRTEATSPAALAGLPVGNVYGAAVPMDGRRDYWIEYHPGNATSFDGSVNGVRDGVQIRWRAYTGMVKANATDGRTGTILLDLNSMRASADAGVEGGNYGQSHFDSTLMPGQMFADPTTNFSITVIETGSDSAGKFCKVRVSFLPSSEIPNVELLGETTAISGPGTVRFRSTVSNVDVTATPHYSWEVMNRLGQWARQPTVSSGEGSRLISFPFSGVYRVRLTVSDGTGNQTSDSVLVRVGQPTAPMISGRVVDVTGNGMANVSVGIAAPGNIPNFDVFLLGSAITDADGYYAFVRPVDANGNPRSDFRLVAAKTGWTVDVIRDMEPIAPSGGVTSVAFDDVRRTRLDFVALPRTHVEVSGRVTQSFSATKGVPGVPLRIGDQTAYTDADGRYSVRLPAGRYAPPLATLDNRPLNAGADIDATFGDVTHNFSIGFGKLIYVVLDGYVPGVNNDGAVTAFDSLGVNSVGLPRYDDDPDNGFIGYRVVINTKQDGPATLRVRGSNGQSWVRADGGSGPIDLGDDTAVVLHFTRAVNTANVAGRATGDAAIDGATVRLKRASDGSLVREVETDLFGAFCFAGVSPGAYFIDVSKPGVSFVATRATVTVSGPSTGPTADVTGVEFFARRAFDVPAFVPGEVTATLQPMPHVLLAAAPDVIADPSTRYQWSVTLANGQPASGVAFADAHAATTLVTFPHGGDYLLSVIAVDRFGRSATALTRTITVAAVADHVAPTLRSIGFAYEREQALYLQFSEPLAAGFDLRTAMTLTNGTANLMADWADYDVSPPDAPTNTARIKKVTGGQVFADGRYLLAVAMADVPDAGGAFGRDATLREFAMLGGDADMNGTTNFVDYGTLGMNYNQTNATWSMGDFNYDGKVDFQDQAILSMRYNQSV